MHDGLPKEPSGDPLRGSMSMLLQNWTANENQIAQWIQAEYFPRLRNLSARVLQGLPGANVDADDVIQSALKSFCLYMRRNASADGKDRDDVWRLLCHIAARKASRRRKRQTRGLSGGVVIAMTDLTDNEDSHPIDGIIQQLSSDEFDLIIKDAVESLDQSLQPIALMVMEGKSQEEISQTLNCSKRTVIRKFHLVKTLLKSVLE